MHWDRGLPWAVWEAPGLGEGTPGPEEARSLGQSGPVSAPFFQMYQKEKQVLEELSRYTGTRLQPLSRDLF